MRWFHWALFSAGILSWTIYGGCRIAELFGHQMITYERGLDLRLQGVTWFVILLLLRPRPGRREEL